MFGEYPGQVAARRLILAMVALLLISSVIAALVPVPRDEVPAGTAPATETRASGELVSRTLRAAAKKPQRIEIRLGDQLSLRVTSKVVDEVEIPALGELADVDPDSPAHFDLLPFETGTYNVRMRGSGKMVGRIVVRGRAGGADQPEPSSIDSPGESTQAFTPGARRAT
jgi:hypothetical protein